MHVYIVFFNIFQACFFFFPSPLWFSSHVQPPRQVVADVTAAVVYQLVDGLTNDPPWANDARCRFDDVAREVWRGRNG